MNMATQSPSVTYVLAWFSKNDLILSYVGGGSLYLIEYSLRVLSFEFNTATFESIAAMMLLTLPIVNE